MLSLLGLPLIYPYPLAVYILDFISGLGVGPIWYTLGWVIIRSSTAKTLDRNIGIIFFFYMLGPTLGNFFLFVSFSGKTVISDEVRYITVAILYVIGFLGPLTMIFFDQSALDSSPEEGDLSEETEPLVQLRKDKVSLTDVKFLSGLLQLTGTSRVNHREKHITHKILYSSCV